MKPPIWLISLDFPYWIGFMKLCSLSFQPHDLHWLDLGVATNIFGAN